MADEVLTSRDGAGLTIDRQPGVAARTGQGDIDFRFGPFALAPGDVGADGLVEEALQRARSWWNPNGNTPVTSFYDGSSSSARLTGLMWSAAYDECPQAEYTGMAMEYGTLPIVEMIGALRADHWLHLHPEAPAEQQAAIKSQILNAFYVNTDEWRKQIVDQAREAMFQAVDGLTA